jgi:hypothetical protein
VKINSIVDITGGKLLTSPAISFITQTHTNLKKVSDGDLFISSNFEEIQEAIKKGAFGIIFDVEIDIKTLDNEIALIKVDSIDRAITKLLRFKLSNFNIESYVVDFIAYEFLDVLLKSNKNTYFLNNPKLTLEMLQDIEDGDTIISEDAKFLSDIYPKTKNLEVLNMNFENLLIHSIFETSFLFKGEYFYKLRVPYIYLNHLLFIKETFKIDDIDGQKLKNISFIQPIFLNKQNQIIDYGKSNRFILTSKCEHIAKIEFEFINAIFKYGKSIKIDATNLNDNEIYKIISNNKTNCLYFANQTNEKIVEILKQNEIKEQTLF